MEVAARGQIEKAWTQMADALHQMARTNLSQKQGTRPDRSKRLLGTLGLWMLGGTMKRRIDLGAAKMSMERGKGGSNFCLKLHGVPSRQQMKWHSRK